MIRKLIIGMAALVAANTAQACNEDALYPEVVEPPVIISASFL